MGLFCTLVHKPLPLIETLISRNVKEVPEISQSAGKFRRQIKLIDSSYKLIVLSYSLVEEVALLQLSM